MTRQSVQREFAGLSGYYGWWTLRFILKVERLVTPKSRSSFTSKSVSTLYMLEFPDLRNGSKASTSFCEVLKEELNI